MTPRERNLAIIFGGMFAFTVLAAGYLLVYEPLQAKANAAATLEADVKALEDKERTLQPALAKLKVAQTRSLPADSNTARREYTVMMTRLLAKANIPQNAVTVKEKSSADVRGIPLLANKKPAYTKVAYDIDLKNVDMWQVEDFLTDFYELNLLHQITVISIKHDDGGTRKGPIDRKDLTVNLTCEAIIVDGADNRPSLLPVPAGFAALGGWRGHNAIAFNPDPEPARRLEPFQFAPVMATRKRDYSFLVRRDMFHGFYPDPPPAAIARITDLSTPLGQPLTPVKLALTGDVPAGPVTWTAKADGKLLTDGGVVKVDSTRQTVSIAPALGESGTGSVSVTAMLPNGKELRSSFKVTVIAPEPKIDISTNIVLILATSRSDGTASAVIRDQFTPHNYEIDATAKDVKVQKFWYIAGKKKEDGAPTPLLTIADDISGTKRVFKVVALDSDGMIVADLTPPPAKPGMPAPGKGFTPGVRPGTPPAPRMGDPTPESPLAAAVGAPLAATGSGTKLFRWSVGKSLKQITEVDKTEAKAILTRAEKTGPVADTAPDKTKGLISAPVTTPTKFDIAPAPRVKEPAEVVVSKFDVAPPPRQIEPKSNATIENNASILPAEFLGKWEDKRDVMFKSSVRLDEKGFAGILLYWTDVQALPLSLGNAKVVSSKPGEYRINISLNSVDGNQPVNLDSVWEFTLSKDKETLNLDLVAGSAPKKSFRFKKVDDKETDKKP